MWRYILGGAAALLMATAGVLWFNARARTNATPLLAAAPAAMAPAAAATGDALPTSVPEATDQTREQKRFARYDRDRDGIVSREEYLASRRKAFAKLDTNHDGTLSFDEWSSKTIAKFVAADHDRSGSLIPAEFAATAPKRSAHPRKCPPTQVAREDDRGE
ncbi:histidine kinase [uncultured Sphingomonas sp.]|uniref:histidine kinase n=1 Tax=uncultured Sphingomonas sp. TaxID=158754 RepID=UPI0035C9683C